MLSYFGCQDDTVNHFSDTIWQTPYFCPFLAKAANTCMHVHIHPLLTLFMASFLSFSLSQILLSTVIGQIKYLMEDRLTGKTESVCKILKQQLVKHWNWKKSDNIRKRFLELLWTSYIFPQIQLRVTISHFEKDWSRLLSRYSLVLSSENQLVALQEAHLWSQFAG